MTSVRGKEGSEVSEVERQNLLWAGCHMQVRGQRAGALGLWERRGEGLEMGESTSPRMGPGKHPTGTR